VHVARVVEFKGTHEVLAGKFGRGKRPLGKIWRRERNNAEMNVGRFAWHRTGTSIGLKHGHELLGFVIGGEFRYSPRDF